MKKSILIAVFALLAATSINAQNGYDNTKHEVAISTGILSNSQWIDIFAEVAVMEVGGTFSNEDFTGPFCVEYFYRLKEWLSVGGIFSYGNSTMDYTKPSSTTIDGTLTNRYYSLMPALKLDWLRTKYFGMYSKLAIGYTFRTLHLEYTDGVTEAENDHTGHLNWQASLLGLEAGAPRFRAFLEAGIGEQGVVVLGLRYKF